MPMDTRHTYVDSHMHMHVFANPCVYVHVCGHTTMWYRAQFLKIVV